MNNQVEEAKVLRDRLLRCTADLENLRKRTAKDIERETARANQSTLIDFLDVIDSIERALALGSDEDENDSWFQGMKAIHRQMLDTLKRQGARPFDSLGERFDPHRHEAVSCEFDESKEERTIVKVVKTGYEMNDGRLLRAAEVVTTLRSDNDG